MAMIFYIKILFFSINLFFIISKKIQKKLQILIYFRVTEFNAVVKAWYIPVNTDRLIIKHYGN